MYETIDTLKEIEKQYNFLSKDIDMSKAKFSLMCRCITAEIKHGETKYHNNVKHGYANSLQAIKDFYETTQKDKLQYNYYISVNTFFIPKRANKYLHKLNCLFVDIDNHSTITDRHSIDSLYFYLADEFFNRKVPTPSMVIFTGRGLQLYWKIKPLSYNSQNIRYWNKIEQKLINAFDSFAFEDFTIDKAVKDASRILRMAGTYNAKAFQFAEIYDSTENEYTLTEINQNFFDTGYRPKKKKKSKTNKKGYIKTQKKQEYSVTAEKTLLNNRLFDLQRLVDIRQGNLQGKRQMLIWQAGNILRQLNYTAADASHVLYEINNRFTVPLPESEIEHDLSRESIYNKLTNNYLIDLFEITPVEQQHLKTLINNKEKQLRLAQQKKTKQNNRQTIKQELAQDIKAYAAQGLTQSQIAQTTGLNIRTVKGYYKELGINKKVTSNKENVLLLKNKGMTQQETADKLGISIRTVRTYWHKEIA